MFKIATPISSKHSEIKFLGWKKFVTAKLCSCFIILKTLTLSFHMESILTLPSDKPAQGYEVGFGDWHPTELCHLHVRNQERRFKEVPRPGQAPVNTLQRLRPSRASCPAPCPEQAQWKCYNTGHQPWEKCSFHKYVWVFQPITRPAIILHILLYTLQGRWRR